MKYVDEFRDPLKAQFLLAEIRELVARIQVGAADPCTSWKSAVAIHTRFSAMV